MRSVILSLSVVGTVAALATLSCSSPGNGNANDGGGAGNEGSAGDGGCVPYTPPATTSLMTPSVSFVKDVMPAFANGCAFSGCHISMTGNLQFLYDQDHTMPAAMFAKTVYNGIVNKKTLEDPTMNFVTPGDPANSFLMRKMDFDVCELAAQCDGKNPLYQMYSSASGQYPAPTACGVGMPPTQDTPLDQSTRDIVRRWIAQGANNN